MKREEIIYVCMYKAPCKLKPSRSFNMAMLTTIHCLFERIIVAFLFTMQNHKCMFLISVCGMSTTYSVVLHSKYRAYHYWRYLSKQNKKSLKHQIRKSWSYCYIICKENEIGQKVGIFAIPFAFIIYMYLIY